MRSRPAQSLESFLRQSTAVLTHDVEGRLSAITAPTLITSGRHDAATSTRFAERLKTIRNSEMFVFENCSHAPMYEDVAGFNDKTLHFLQQHAGLDSAFATIRAS